MDFKEVNKIISIYKIFSGREFKGNRLLYADNEKSQPWLLSRGHQLPKANTNIGSNIIIRNSAEKTSKHILLYLRNAL